MKKLLYLMVAASAFASCAVADDENYAEGRITTLAAADLTPQSAALSGNIEITTSGSATLEVADRGFVFGTKSDDLNRSVRNSTGGAGSFTCLAEGLTPNTKYYARAYASFGKDADNAKKFYGNTIEFTTIDGVVIDYVELPQANIAVQKTDISSGTDWSSAQSLCAASRVGEFSDWRLPTIGELSVLYTNMTTIGGFTTTYSNSWYWSSSSQSYGYNNYYYYYDFYSGSQSLDYSNNNYRVRCVRDL